jgi:hypothetical protein
MASTTPDDDLILPQLQGSAAAAHRPRTNLRNVQVRGLPLYGDGKAKSKRHDGGA